MPGFGGAFCFLPGSFFRGLPCFGSGNQTHDLRRTELLLHAIVILKLRSEHFVFFAGLFSAPFVNVAVTGNGLILALQVLEIPAQILEPVIQRQRRFPKPF